MPPLRVDIWSDIACPWCYVGKRRFETALERFEHREAVSGAQPATLFLQALERAIGELVPSLLSFAEGAVCGPDGCNDASNPT